MITNELIEEQLAAGCSCIVNTTMHVLETRYWSECDEFWSVTLFEHFGVGCPFRELVTFTEITVLEHCAYCESTRNVKEFDGQGDLQGKKVLLCAVDASTFGGNNEMYHRMYADSYRIMRHISQTTNLILEAIEKG